MEKWAGSFQDMVSSLDFNLNAMGSHWKILSKKVTQIDLHFHKMFQNSGPRWCRQEGWLREPNVPLYPASLFTCPDLGPGNKCPDTGPSLSKQSPGLQVLQLEHSLGHQPPTQGCIFFASSPPAGRPTPFAPFPKVHLNSSRSAGRLWQLLSSASCWGLPDTGADLVNRKLSTKQGR